MDNTLTSVEIEGMDYDSFTAEYGEVPTLESLKARYPQYASDPDEAWQALEEQNNESLNRWLSQGRY